MYQNLHSHTKASDGKLTHQETLDICAKNRISVVAFSDHDALPDKKALKILKQNRGHQTKWIIGCEISSGWPKEISGPASNFHIVGLFVDPLNKKLVDHCQKAQESRIERMKKIVENLHSLGFKISRKDCLAEGSEESLGRPHIVSALLKKEENLKILEKIKNKMAEEAKRKTSLKPEYDEMIKRGIVQYPYTLFLDQKAFLPGIYVDYSYYCDMDQSVKLIREAGGNAILAHWSFSKNKVDEKMIANFFKQKRLDGAEIIFGADKVINLKDKEIKKDMGLMEKLTKKYSVLQSGGADSHAEKDFNFFVKEKWFAKKTIGLVEKMAKLKDLNFEFSSLKH